jgi:hypothetical protein
VSDAGLTLTEAAKRLGIARAEPGRWLRAWLLRREAELGVPLLLRVGRGRRRPTYRVSLDTIRLRCPDLASGTVARAVNAGLGDRLRALEREVQSQREDLDELAAQVAALTLAVRRLGETSRRR